MLTSNLVYQPVFTATSEKIFIEPLLDQGYIVSVPDYESQNDAFGAGIQSGHAVLDSIRAVLAFSELALDPNNVRIQAWGYSGGALATGWAGKSSERDLYCRLRSRKPS